MTSERMNMMSICVKDAQGPYHYDFRQRSTTEGSKIFPLRSLHLSILQFGNTSAAMSRARSHMPSLELA